MWESRSCWLLLLMVGVVLTLADEASNSMMKGGDSSVVAAGEYVHALDSDFLLLYIDDTSLPHSSIGRGVFAKYDIAANEIVCEYRGALVDAPTREKMHSDKVMQTSGPGGETLFLVGDGICALINDSACITIKNELGQFVVPYSDAEIDAFEVSPFLDSIPTHPGFPYNARYDILNTTGKVFVRSLRHIAAGSEIFAPYGG